MKENKYLIPALIGSVIAYFASKKIEEGVNHKRMMQGMRQSCEYANERINKIGVRIKDLKQKGYSMQKIAEELGIAESAVRHYCETNNI